MSSRKFSLNCGISLFLLCNYLIIGVYSNCNGCSTGGLSEGTDCYNLVNDSVYACRGTFEGGLFSSSAESICSENYEICESSQRINDLGVTQDICGNPPFLINEFFASKESSSGNFICNTEGIVGIWGCALTDIFNPVQNVGSFGTPPIPGSFGCGVLTAFISYSKSSWGAWSFKNDTSELLTAKLSSKNNGGVLCCKKATSSPTKNPTLLPSAQPTLEPTSFPTRSITSKFTNQPTKFLTKTISPSKTANYPTFTTTNAYPTKSEIKITSISTKPQITNSPTYNPTTKTSTKEPTSSEILFPPKTDKVKQLSFGVVKTYSVGTFVICFAIFFLAILLFTIFKIFKKQSKSSKSLYSATILTLIGYQLFVFFHMHHNNSYLSSLGISDLDVYLILTIPIITNLLILFLSIWYCHKTYPKIINHTFKKLKLHNKCHNTSLFLSLAIILILIFIVSLILLLFTQIKMNYVSACLGIIGLIMSSFLFFVGNKRNFSENTEEEKGLTIILWTSIFTMLLFLIFTGESIMISTKISDVLNFCRLLIELIFVSFSMILFFTVNSPNDLEPNDFEPSGNSGQKKMTEIVVN